MGILEGKINKPVELIVSDKAETLASVAETTANEPPMIRAKAKPAAVGKPEYEKTSLYIKIKYHRKLKSFCGEQGITLTDAINECIRIFLAQNGIFVE